MIGIAHSIGALVMAGANNVSEISRFVLICPHTGYFGDYSLAYRLPMYFLWHFLMPLLTRMFGFFPGRLLNLGADIPAGVALQWAARRSPELRPEDTNADPARARNMIARYGQVRGDAYALGFSDDAFATEQGMRRLLKLLPGLQSRIDLIRPHDMSLHSIGHFGFFGREAGPKLWSRVLTFLRPVGSSSAALRESRAR